MTRRFTLAAPDASSAVVLPRLLGLMVALPLLTFIALPLILLTFGIAYFFVNVAMLLFTEWVVPNFSIDGFWTYVGATIVLWLVNWLVSQLVWSVADNRP